MFDRFYMKKWRFFFTDLMRKFGVFGVNFILQKFCPCKKKRQISGMVFISRYLFNGLCQQNVHLDLNESATLALYNDHIKVAIYLDLL